MVPSRCVAAQFVLNLFFFHGSQGNAFLQRRLPKTDRWWHTRDTDLPWSTHSSPVPGDSRSPWLCGACPKAVPTNPPRKRSQVRSTHDHKSDYRTCCGDQGGARNAASCAMRDRADYRRRFASLEDATNLRTGTHPLPWAALYLDNTPCD